PVDELREGGLPGLDDSPCNLVGVHDDSAALGEQISDGGLAGSDPAGEPDEQHSGVLGRRRFARFYGWRWFTPFIRRRGSFGRRGRAGVAGVRTGTDVLTMLVEVLLAEVLAVLGRDLTALGGLLDRQRDAPPVEVDVDDLHPQLLARRDYLLGRLDVV